MVPECHLVYIRDQRKKTTITTDWISQAQVSESLEVWFISLSKD